MELLSCLALVSFALVVCVYEITRQRSLPYDFLFLFNVSYLVYYVLAPIHLILGGGRFSYFPATVDAALANNGLGFLIGYVAVIAVCWIFVCLSYEAVSRRLQYVRPFIRSIGLRDLALVTCAFALVGVASLYIYSAQYGGVEFAIRNASRIRGRQFANDSSLLFLRNISLLSVSAGLIGICMAMRVKRCLLAWVFYAFLAVLLCIVVLTLALQGSRRSYVIFLACVGLFYANYRNRRYIGRIFVIASVALAYIAVGDLLNFGLSAGWEFIFAGFEQFARQGSELIYARLWSDFSLPAVESWVVLTQFEGFPRLFIDIPVGILELIPERALEVPLPTPLSELSTQLIAGQSASEVAEIPPAFIGFFWYSAYSLGLVIGPCAFGAVGAWAERHLRPDESREPLTVMAYTVAGFVWAYFLREGIPYMLFVERFHWWVLLATIVFLQLRSNLLTGQYSNRISRS